MLRQEDAFLRVIREQPDDDTIRLIYADWLMDQDDKERRQRGEFVRLQVELATQRHHPNLIDLKGRECMLLALNWETWVGPLREFVRGGGRESLMMGGYRTECVSRFRRGFIEALSLDCSTFLARAAELFQLTPLQRLRLVDAGSHLADLAASPYLGDLQDLAFIDYYRDPLDATMVAALAQSRYLGRLRHLGLYNNNVGDRGLEALATAPWLGQLVSVNLANCGIGPEGIAALLQPYDGHHGTLALRSLELSDNAIGDQGAFLLSRSRLLRQLSYLGLEHNSISSVGCRELRASIHLGAPTVLKLRGNGGE
jgi:uncharacterized protein (TIGR02996 family)